MWCGVMCELLQWQGLDPVPPPNHGWDLAPLSRMSVVDLDCAAKQAVRLGWARVRKTLDWAGEILGRSEVK